jgi:site-specific DNA recombinase
VDQIRCIGEDPAVVAATLAELRRQSKKAVERLRRERTALDRQRRADEAEMCRLAATPVTNGKLAHLAEVQERIGVAARRVTELEDELARLTASEIDDSEVSAALADFDSVWGALTPREQARVPELLIERVDHDGERGHVSITFRPTGIKALAGELSDYEEAAA